MESDETRGGEPAEAATGSGGLFGDKRHEAEQVADRLQDPAAIHVAGVDGMPDQARPEHRHESTTEEQPPYQAPLRGSSSDERPPQQNAALGAGTHQTNTLQSSQVDGEHSLSGTSQPQRLASADGVSNEQPLTHNEPVPSHQQGAVPASGNPQLAGQLPAQPPRDDHIAEEDLEHPPPLVEAQLAEEQDLVPDDIDETDSAIGSDTQSATTSLSESVFNYRREHGRTYHAYKDGKYIFPNDEREADRLDLQHHLFRLTFANGLFFAPLDKPRRCLDVGTGTGIWAVDFADEFPDCQVVGIDLSPGQPTLVPPNLKFVIDDAEDMWIYPDKFDFIHARLMAGCFADWPNFFRQAYENLEPGGWLELQDYGLPVKFADGSADNTDLLRWGELLCEAARKFGRPMGSDCAEHYLTWMAEAGFVDVQQRMFMWPSNSWPKDPFMKELGRWNQINILEGLEGFCLALLTRGLGWRKEEVDVFVARVSRDFRDRKIHAYFPMPVCFARKPFPGEVPFQG